jgi:hypothetical protein
VIDSNPPGSDQRSSHLDDRHFEDGRSFSKGYDYNHKAKTPSYSVLDKKS